MTGVRLEVQWSPIHPNLFITWGTEIFLYETLPRKEILKPSYIPISDTSVSHLLATNSNHHYVKCVDIYPRLEPDILLAIGQANGKVVLTTFGPTTFDSIGLAGLELTPKHARQCNTVAWNPIDSNLIAAGLDKYRTDHSVLLWDVLKCPTSRSHGASTPSDYTRPVAELGLSDTAHSLAWLNSQPQSLVIGMNNKHLKMVDLRDPSKAANSAPTKAVYGIVVAPNSDHQLASYFENQIAIWDTRSFEKPVLTLPQAKPVSKLLWCPTRHNLLGSLQKDSAVIHLHDVQQSMDETEPSVLERSVQPGSSTQITSFSWHPTHENRLLTIALTGILTDYVVFERMTVNWSSSSHVVWTFGRKTLKMINDRDKVYKNINDISTKMKRRAMDGYGLKGELWQNGELVDDESLKNLWQWLYLSRSLVEDGHIDVNGTSKHPGVRCVLGMDNSTSIATKSDLVCLPWADLPSNQTTARVYRSDDRDIALQLCGWKFERDSCALNNFLDRLEVECDYPRAAAIAVFNLRLRTAIHILNRGAIVENKTDSLNSLNIVAMALSGYSDSKNSMWRELCLNTKAQISNPYLRATFGFLTADGDNYDAVLNETGITVHDRVAFACIFLSNSRLYEYLNQLTDVLIQEGNLAGMLLTGASTGGIPLLQRYLDCTGDVQSVSLISIRSFPSSLLDQDPYIQEWISSYRGLLDSWRLWTQRAHVDITLNSHNANAKPVQQVFVSCNFCGKSISVYMQGGSRNRGQMARLGTTANKLKMSSCPNCRKPQPRCAICLINMGTPSCYQGISQATGSPTRPSTIKLTDFGSWFTWCQTCRHGGHSAHMSQWFREHSECPVTACTCRCLSLDAASKITSVGSQKNKSYESIK